MKKKIHVFHDPTTIPFLSLCCPSSALAVHLVDIWNVIEAFRENGLNTMDLNTEFSVARLEAILSTVFFQLNKRLPTTHQINIEQSVLLLLNFLLAAYDPYVSFAWTDILLLLVAQAGMSGINGLTVFFKEKLITQQVLASMFVVFLTFVEARTTGW